MSGTRPGSGAQGEPAAAVVRSWREAFAAQKRLAEGAIGQLSEEQLHARLAPGLNSIAVIVQHVAGNLRSRFGPRWLEVDGERPDRDRDGEFVDRGLGRGALMALWEDGWACLFAAIDRLGEGDLGRVVRIRGEAHTVPAAMARALAHAGYHAGQIMLIARGVRGEEGWEWVTIRPGGSGEFNRGRGV